jgi:hypothetical protein
MLYDLDAAADTQRHEEKQRLKAALAHADTVVALQRHDVELALSHALQGRDVLRDAWEFRTTENASIMFVNTLMLTTTFIAWSQSGLGSMADQLQSLRNAASTEEATLNVLRSAAPSTTGTVSQKATLLSALLAASPFARPVDDFHLFQAPKAQIPLLFLFLGLALAGHFASIMLTAAIQRRMGAFRALTHGSLGIGGRAGGDGRQELPAETCELFPDVAAQFAATAGIAQPTARGAGGGSNAEAGAARAGLRGTAAGVGASRSGDGAMGSGPQQLPELLAALNGEFGGGDDDETTTTTSTGTHLSTEMDLSGHGAATATGPRSRQDSGKGSFARRRVLVDDAISASGSAGAPAGAVVEKSPRRGGSHSGLRSLMSPQTVGSEMSRSPSSVPAPPAAGAAPQLLADSSHLLRGIDETDGPAAQRERRRLRKFLKWHARTQLHYYNTAGSAADGGGAVAVDVDGRRGGGGGAPASPIAPSVTRRSVGRVTDYSPASVRSDVAGGRERGGGGNKQVDDPALGATYQPCGKRHETFADYYTCHCEHLRRWSVAMLILGATASAAASCVIVLLTYALLLGPRWNPLVASVWASPASSNESDSSSGSVSPAASNSDNGSSGGGGFHMADAVRVSLPQLAAFASHFSVTLPAFIASSSAAVSTVLSWSGGVTSRVTNAVTGSGSGSTGGSSSGSSFDSVFKWAATSFGGHYAAGWLFTILVIAGFAAAAWFEFRFPDNVLAASHRAPPTALADMSVGRSYSSQPRARGRAYDDVGPRNAGAAIRAPF